MWLLQASVPCKCACLQLGLCQFLRWLLWQLQAHRPDRLHRVWLLWQQAQWVLPLVLPGWLQQVLLGWPILWRRLCLALPWLALVRLHLGS